MTDLIDSQLTGPPEAGRAPLDCVVCGHVPAADVSFYRHIGLVLYVRFNRIQGPFCRDCGLAKMRDATAETVTSGLWSPVSFVLAPLALVRNLVGRRTVLALAKPLPRPGQPESNLAPLLPTRPVFRRFKSWFAPAVLAGVIAFVTLADLPSAEKLDVVGGCVKFDRVLHVDSADFVRCDGDHDAVITSIENTWQDCAGPYVEKLYRYYCLEPAAGAGPLVNVP